MQRVLERGVESQIENLTDALLRRERVLALPRSGRGRQSRRGGQHPRLTPPGARRAGVDLAPMSERAAGWRVHSL